MNSDLFFGLKKNKKEDKGQFLKSQKEAREQREQAKKEQKCALKIQALYRSAKVRQKLLRDLVADRFKKLGDVYKLKDKLSPLQFSLIANKIFQYKGFLSFVVLLKPSNAKDYKELVIVLSDFLLSSLDTEDALFLDILNKNRKTRVAWYVKLKHILNSLLQIAFGTATTGEIDEMNDGSKEKTLAVQLLNKVMKINTSVWPALGNALTKNKDLELALRKEIKQNLTNSISSGVIQNIIVSQEFKQSSFLRKFILKTAIDRHDISNEGMFMELMSLQSFYNELKAMTTEKRLKLVNFLIRQIEKEQYSVKDARFTQRFIKELVEFLHFTITNNLLQGLDAKFFHNLFNILSTYIESYNSAMLTIIENKKIIENSMEVEEEKGSPTKSPGKQKTIEIRTVIAKNPSMALSLDSNGIKHFCEIISGVFAMFTSADFDTFSTLIAKGCETLLLFKRSLKSNDKNLLKNILSFQLNFYYLPFMCIKRQGYNVKSMLFVPEKYIPIIKVFSQVLYQTLRITDDEEFLGNTEIVQSSWLLVTKDDLIEIANFTNHLLYSIIWDRVVSYYPVISSEVKLVRELYNRDSRTKYCPKNFWIIPELEGMTQTLLSDPGHLKIEALRDIIDKVPHMLTFETRLKILYRMIEKDKEEYDRFPGFDPEYDIDDDDDREEGQTKDPKVMSIHRQYLLEDGFEKISKRRDMRSLFMIRFINEHGMPEEGIDGGGLLKEFITLIGKTAFDVNYGLFVENEDKTLMPNQNSHLNPEHLKLFNFLGRLTGKGIYEHILLESVFSVIFLNRLLKIPNTINELKFADPTLYKNLMLLKHRNDVADKLHLTFSVDETAMGNTRTHLLKANGDQIEVNETNKLEYLSLFCDYKLNQVIKDQSQAFLNGLKSCIDLSWIKMFNHEELQYVISGMRKKGFNVEDLKANVEYRGFDLQGPTLTHFWEVINEMSEDERSLFLLFVTGCSRPPTLGFKFMEPKIAIHNSSNDINDIEKLPTASTCANLFKLPNYKDKELLRKKLMYAINANAGFDLG